MNSSELRAIKDDLAAPARASANLTRCGIVSFVAVAVAVFFRHGELAALAVPFTLAPAWHYRRNSPILASATLRIGASQVTEHEIVHIDVVVIGDKLFGLVKIRLDPGEFGLVGPKAQLISLEPGVSRSVTFDVSAPHWGLLRVGPATIVSSATALLTQPTRTATTSRRIAVLPPSDTVRGAEEVPHALVYSGEHLSTQRGVGTRFSEVRPFDPGDRLRQINWRASLKLRQPHVNATEAERSARVLIALDTAGNLGPRGSSVLDVSVRAANAIANYYLRAGDAVGLIECGARGRVLQAATGQRQGQRIRTWLLETREMGNSGAIPGPTWLSSIPVARSLVVVLTPLLDAEAARNLIGLRRRGASLIVIDTLSGEAMPAIGDPVSELAKRLWLMERNRLASRLLDIGIPVTTWATSGSLVSVLRDAARIAAAPRLVTR